MTQKLLFTLILSGPVAALVIAWIVRWRSRFNAVIQGTCARCGYTTALLPENQPCPECEYPIGRPIPEPGKIGRLFYFLPLMCCAATYLPLVIVANFDGQNSALLGFMWCVLAALQIICTVHTNGRLPPVLLKVALAAASITVLACGAYFIVELQQIANARRPWMYGRQSHMQLIAFTSPLVAGIASLWVWTLIVLAAIPTEVRRRRFQGVGMYHTPERPSISAQSDKPPRRI
jgi:hypothetical protein